MDSQKMDKLFSQKGEKLFRTPKGENFNKFGHIKIIPEGQYKNRDSPKSIESATIYTKIILLQTKEGNTRVPKKMLKKFISR